MPSENQNRSRKWSHKLDGIWVERITMVSFLTIPLRLRCLRSSEISIGGIASRSRGTNQFQTIQFSLHRRRRSRKQYRYFSSDSDNFQQIVSLCSSDLVSDSGLIVSENWLYKREIIPLLLHFVCPDLNSVMWSKLVLRFYFYLWHKESKYSNMWYNDSDFSYLFKSI